MASISELYGRDAVAVARDALNSATEKKRRADAAINDRLLHDDGVDALKDAIRPLFPDNEVYRRVSSFAEFTNSQGLFARIINELARPVYSTIPTRKIDPGSDDQTFADLRRETRYDARMDLLLRYGLANGDALMYTRYIPRLEQVRVEAVPAHAYSIIPHPDDPTLPCGVCVDVWRGTADKPNVVVWDDSQMREIDPEGTLVGLQRHNLPRMPFVHLHVGERSGSYWDASAAKALRAADLQCRLLNLLGLRHIKVRGFDKYVVSGDYSSLPKDQPLDEEGAISAPDGVTISTLGDRSDAKPYLDMLSAIKLDAAANRGISRARLNQDKADASDDKGLEEERSELIRIMAPVEKEQVEVLAMVSREHPTLKMSEGATLAWIDYGELAHRVDRETQLKIRQTERSMGVRCILDDLRDDNPEIVTDEDAWAELERNIAAESRFIEARRALNMPKDASVTEPGQDPQQNGAMGPKVARGEMSPGEARDMARDKGSMPDGMMSED